MTKRKVTTEENNPNKKLKIGERERVLCKRRLYLIQNAKQ
jgi:hypothetical protein